MNWLTQIFRPHSPQGRADMLMKRGVDYVEKGKTHEALAIAKTLHSLRYSGAFEVEAQALAGDGAKDEAIEVLQKGLEAAPDAWLNRNLLGNYLSDQGRYDEAFTAYEEAVQTPKADRILIGANHAMALQRAGRDSDARKMIAEIAAQDLSKSEPALQDFVQSLADQLTI